MASSVLIVCLVLVASCASLPDRSNYANKQCPENEEWTPCISKYFWEKCEDRYNSPPFVPPNPNKCDPRCTCIKDHYRNSDNKCVPFDQCRFESCRPCPRYGWVRGEYSIYHKRPRYGQPRPQPFQRECACYCGGPSNAPKERPCCYDFPCKAHCFNHGACTRPSGRYARTVWFPGECCPVVPPCQAFTHPNPPYHPCCFQTCNRYV